MNPDKKKTILVVDDSALVRRQVRDALTGAGYDTVEARNGREALAAFEGHHFDLVITDFMMPEMSGLELIQAIRESAVRSTVPVVVLSTLATGPLVQQGWDLGVKAWLKKPFKPGMLVSAIAALLDPERNGEVACAS